MGICLALAFASWLRKLLVSPDQRPPTSPARTTSRVRALPNEFGVRAFFSWSGNHSRRTVDVQPLLRALNHRSARLTPAWCPPSATISSLRQSFGLGAARSSCSSPLLLPLRGRSWRRHSRQRSLSSPAHCPSTRSAVVATRVEWTATTASAFGQKQREKETAKEQRAEQMGINACDGASGTRGIRCSRSWSALRPHQSSLGAGHSHKQ